jgi:hypothetical protein
MGLIAAYLWLRPAADELTEFRAYPHAYIADPGFDPALIVIEPGPLPRPTNIERNGVTLWPAYVCSDKQLVPDRDGQPCLFPLIGQGDAIHSPPLPPHNTVLESRTLRLAQPYLTPEAKALLATFQERMQ